MPFALIIIGVVLLAASVQNTQSQLFTLVKNDFTGSNNYLYWMVSILIIGAVGYIPTLKPISRMFLVLLIVVLFLSNGGIFQKFNQQLFGSSSGIGSGNGVLSGSLSNDISSWINNPTGMEGIEQPLAPARPNPTSSY